MYIEKNEITEMVIKECIYLDFQNEDRVEKEYKNLLNGCPRFSKNEAKNIGMYLHELCIVNYDKNVKSKKYLSTWKTKHTDPLLSNLGLSYESVRLCLKFHKRFYTFLIFLINRTQDNYLLTWKEYKSINQQFYKMYSFERYEALRTLFFKTVTKLKHAKHVSDETHIIKTIYKYSKPHLRKYYDVVILKEVYKYIEKIRYYMKEKNVFVCSCSEPHTNYNVIDATITTATNVHYKLKSFESGKWIIECYGNKLYYDFYRSLIDE